MAIPCQLFKYCDNIPDFRVLLKNCEVHTYIVGRYFSDSMMNLRKFTKDTYCKIGLGDQWGGEETWGAGKRNPSAF